MIGKQIIQKDERFFCFCLLLSGFESHSKPFGHCRVT